MRVDVDHHAVEDVVDVIGRARDPYFRATVTTR
jgi:rRNA processing protein Gar1